MTSHAAVAREWVALCCGAGDIRFDRLANKIFIKDKVLVEGIVTIDGTKGDVFAGSVDTIQPTMSSV